MQPLSGLFMPNPCHKGVTNLTKLYLFRPRGNATGRPIRRLLVTFAVTENSRDIEYQVRGKTARTLIALIEAKGEGVTGQETSLTFPLATHVLELQRHYGLSIRAEQEEHPHGWHARYVLETPVRILRTESEKEKQGAA